MSSEDSYSITYQPDTTKTVHDNGGVYQMLEMTEERFAGMCAGALVLFGRFHGQHVRINRFGLPQDPLGILDPEAGYSLAGGTVGSSTAEGRTAEGRTAGKRYTCKLRGPVWTLLVKFNSIDFLLGFANLCTGMFHIPYAGLVTDLVEGARSWLPRTLLEVWYDERSATPRHKLLRVSKAKVKGTSPS